MKIKDKIEILCGKLHFSSVYQQQNFPSNKRLFYYLFYVMLLIANKNYLIKNVQKFLN
jgi:hypothetical protein